MIFDECTPYPATRGRGARLDGAVACAGPSASKRAHEGNDAALFGIVQGGVHHDLRSALGGGPAGRSASTATRSAASRSASRRHERNAMLEHTCPQLPADRPRYLMGVGRPEDLVEAVARGVDMFDCVMPTRNARNGHYFTRYRHGAHPQREVRAATCGRSRRAAAATPARNGFTPRLPAPPGPLQRDAGADAGHPAQPALLPAADGATCARRSSREPSRPSGSPSTPHARPRRLSARRPSAAMPSGPGAAGPWHNPPLFSHCRTPPT